VSHVTATHEDGKVEGRAKSVATNLTALQCELRALFANRPTNRALAEALDRIGTKLEATYAVVHTRLGVHLLSEEWSRGGVEADAQVREQVNTALWESVSTEEARSTRLPGEGDRQVVVTGVLYDQDAQPSGGAALVLRDCDRTRVLQTMAQLEGVLGYLSLLLGDGKSSNRRPAERHAIEPSAAADHPVRLAFSMIGELESRYGFEMTAIGFVRGDRVNVAAISGVEDLRASNPGVAVVRAAMEECLDHGVAVVYSGRGAHTEQEDCRLHAQWSATVQGNTVASFPLVFMDQIVAIVSMSQGAGTPLSREQVALIAEELSGYAALVPLSQAATRSLGAHAVASTRRWLTQIVGRGRRKTAIIALLVSLLGGWIGFGQMRHTFTVPCVVKAADRRTIACPRSGVLAEVFVRPGDRVHSGQLLAAIDANEDFLARAGITAEIESLEALIDQAVAKRESGQIRVHEARKRSLQAQLMIVDASIAEAQIRAPQDGLILEGDLRERLGGRIELGTPMFVLARYDRAAVVLRIPEQLVLAAQEARGATFAPSANPDQTYDLAELLIAPASTVVEERNVFLGEATMTVDLGLLPPGMEGTAYVDAGPRSVFWVLTHKLTDWLRLNFWI
jgi:multidrug efflux pump subunit AcrA (membrane-fusion protein)